MHLRQYQESGIVDDQMQVFPSGWPVPADIGIARRGFPGSGAEAEQSEDPPVGLDEIAQLSTRQGFEAEIMIAVDKLIPHSPSLAGHHLQYL